MKKNLWEELKEILTQNKKTFDYDVNNILISGFLINKNQFKELARQTDYDNQVLEENVNLSLKIIGANWWIERVIIAGISQFQYYENSERPPMYSNNIKTLLVNYPVYKPEFDDDQFEM